MTNVRREIELEGGSPWIVFAEPETDREYLVLVTFFELKSVLRLPKLLRFTLAVRRQLAETRGLVGYSLTAKPPRRFWTLSAWESEKHLRAFIRTLPHAKAMVELPRIMATFGYRRWPAMGRELPPTWGEGLRRLQGS